VHHLSASRRSFLSWLALGLAGLAAVVALIRPPRRDRSADHTSPLITRVELVKILAAGYQQLAADYYWIQTVQATGLAKSAAEYHDIYDYALMVAAVDPKFEAVYPFAGAALPVLLRGGQTANTRESTQILELGYQRFPRHVMVSLLFAFNLAEYFHEYQRAAAVLEQTSKLPNAPRYLLQLATRLHAQAGDFDTGIALAQSLVDSAPDDETRATFETRVKELELERELRRVDAAIETYRTREGSLPGDVATLVAKGDLDRAPVDPWDGTIDIGSDGRAHSSSFAKRFELHHQPAK
jgi:tetratricopeptide (TPR) repeat protein